MPLQSTLSRVQWLYTQFGLMIGFNGLFDTFYGSLLYTLMSSVTPLLSLLGSSFQLQRFSASGLPNCPRYQLPAYKSSSAQQLNRQSQSYIATDGQSVSKSWCWAPSGAYDQIFITVWQLRSCWCVALSLTRGRVCRLQLLLGLASAVILGSEPLGTRDFILLSQIWDSPFRRLLRLAGSQRNRSSSLYSYRLSTDRTENTFPLLQCTCCLAMA
jgi:hypothetical protein